MVESQRKKVAFISTYLPRKCGIATFTSDLITNVAAAARGRFDPLVVAMRSHNDLKYDNPVKFEVRQNVRSDYVCAADFISFSHVDLVSVQHEFGLFGGEAGAYLTLLLKRLQAPIVTTLHTVLNNPDNAYKDAMIDLCRNSQIVITMNERGIDMLDSVYGVQGDKVRLIPHGIPDLPFVDSNYYKHKFGLEGRRTILTFGLLSKNKGIETMLKALPAIKKAEPSVMYIVLGMTHPNILKIDGESYRFSLQRLVKTLELEDNVVFYNRFVDDEELHNFLCATDVYVTPYLNEEQLTSGTLSFAVGSGKAVVSTPYWAAQELLADGRGKLVPFSDSNALAREVIKILQDDLVFYSMRRRAYDYGRSRIWPEIGKQYWALFDGLTASPVPDPKIPVITPTPFELPDPSLDHILRLTDDTGIVQHARFTLPVRDHGYCTDDNARALMLMAKYYAQYGEVQALQLLDRYLSFILHAQRPDGSVRNFMHYDRTWMDPEPASDAYGRFLWALGTVIANPPAPAYISVIKESFDNSVEKIHTQFPRGMAYAALGLCDYLRQFPGASEIKRHLELAADALLHQYQENRSSRWCWFEDVVAYDNGVLPHALFAAAEILENPAYLDVAEASATFLLDTIYRDGHFSFVGCHGWYERGGDRACFDQQPIEVASIVMMCRAACNVTKNREYLVYQRKAFDWFLGANDLHIPLYDFKTKGCCDGLGAGGVNTNQGAESSLSFLLSLLEIIDTCTLWDKLQGEPTRSVCEGRKNRPSALPIIDIPTKSTKTSNENAQDLK